MALKKPVIVSDAPPLKRIVEETQCGLVFKSGDYNDFSKKVLSLTDGALRETLGENGYEAVNGRYNWETDRGILIKIFEGLNARCSN